MIETLKESKRLISAVAFLLVVVVVFWVAKGFYDERKKDEGVAELVQQSGTQIKENKNDAKKFKKAADGLGGDGLIDSVLSKTGGDSRLFGVERITCLADAKGENVSGFIADSECSATEKLHYFKNKAQEASEILPESREACQVIYGFDKNYNIIAIETCDE